MTTPLEDVEGVVALKAAVKSLNPSAVVVTAVTATSNTVSELLGALEEVALTLAIRDLRATLMIAPLTSLKTWC